MNLSKENYFINSENKYENLEISRKKIFTEAFRTIYFVFQFQKTLISRANNFLYSLSRVKFILETLYVMTRKIIISEYEKKIGEKNSLIREIIRQENIYHSHLFLMKEFIRNKCDYLLIIEDDVEKISDFLPEILDRTTQLMKIHQVHLVDISHSFTDRQIGREFFLDEEIKFDFKSALLTYSYPITNTVCANLYSKQLIQEMVRAIEQFKFPTLYPVDHKFNTVFDYLISTGRMKSNFSGRVRPALFNQMSIHDLEKNKK